MKKSLFIPALIALLTGVSCQVLEDPSGKDDLLRQEIILSGSVGDFTKITEDGFSNGDVAGLSIGAPVNAVNVPITYASGAFTPSYTLYWAQGQASTQKSAFAACYPYQQDVNPLNEFTFTVKADQSAEGAVSASDLLTAYTQASPSDQTVKLSFGHALSRIVFDVDASATGDGIVSILAEGVKLSAKVNIPSGSCSAAGDAATVKAGMDGNFYVAVMAPQTASPALVITTTRGKQLRYVPDAPLNLQAGKQIVAHIVIDNDAVVSFMADVAPWTNKEIIISGQSQGTGEHSWSILMGSGSGPVEEQMEPNADGTYSITIDGSPYFYVIRDGEYYFGSVQNNNQYIYQITGLEDVLEYPLILVDEADIHNMEGHMIHVVNMSSARSATVTLNPAKYTLTFKVIPHKWASAGKGKLIDGLLNDAVGQFSAQEWEVEMDADENYPGVYRIRNPYGPASSWFDTAEYWSYDPSGEIIVNTEDGLAWLSDSFTGVTYKDGRPMLASSFVYDNWWWEGDQTFYGKYDAQNKFIWFDSYLAVDLEQFGKAGPYATNRDGRMCITLPGGTRTVKFDKLEKCGLNDSYAASANEVGIGFKAGFEVASVEYATVPGLVSAQEAAASAQFTPLQGFVAGGRNGFSVPSINGGIFTVILKANSKYGTSELYEVHVNYAFDRWLGWWDGFYFGAYGDDTIAMEVGYWGNYPVNAILQFDYTSGNLLAKFHQVEGNFDEYELYVSGITQDGYFCTDPSVTIATFQWTDGDTIEIVPGEYNGYTFAELGVYMYSIKEEEIVNRYASVKLPTELYR